MGIGALFRRAKDKAKSADKAMSEEEKARRRVARATNKIALERARMQLKTAQLERKTKVAEAKAALERAKAEEWQAKRKHVRSIFSGGQDGGKRKRGGGVTRGLARGASAVGRAILGPEPKRKSTTRRRSTTRKKSGVR